MNWTALALHSVIAWLILTLGVGCSPSPMSNLDEEKDPHFITGKNKISSYDYNGAVEAFEKALESNPRSASAHFEIGLLHYQRINDYAAAIYHFDKFLSLNPKHARAETVKQFIITSKQELARTVSLGPINQQVQKELDRLVSTNSFLTSENNRFRDQIQQLQAELSQLRNAPRPPPALNLQSTQSVVGLKLGSNESSFVPPQPGSKPTIDPGATTGPARSDSPQARTSTPLKPNQPGRTHVIAPGDTAAKIGRRYNLSADKILAANPGMDPRKLRVGTTIKLPDK